MKVFSRYIVACGIGVTIDSHSFFCLTIRLNQHLTVLGKHILITVLDPMWVSCRRSDRFGCRFVCISSLLVCIIVAFPHVVVAIAVLDADIELTVLFVGAIHITDITTTKDVTVLTFQLLRCTYRTTVNVYMCLSKDITIGVECTTLTQVVISSTTTKNVAVNIAFKECHISLTSLVDTLQSTNAIVLTSRLDDAASDSGNLTTTEEGVSYVTAIHL